MQAGAPTYLACWSWDADGPQSRGSGNAAKLGERHEDDSGGGVELGCCDLDHRGVAIAQLKDAAARAGGRVVYRLESSTRSKAVTSRTTATGSCQAFGYAVASRGRVRIGIVPGRPDRPGAVVDGERDVDAADHGRAALGRGRPRPAHRGWRRSRPRSACCPAVWRGRRAPTRRRGRPRRGSSPAICPPSRRRREREASGVRSWERASRACQRARPLMGTAAPGVVARVRA